MYFGEYFFQYVLFYSVLSGLRSINILQVPSQGVKMTYIRTSKFLTGPNMSVSTIDHKKTKLTYSKLRSLCPQPSLIKMDKQSQQNG